MIKKYIIFINLLIVLFTFGCKFKDPITVEPPQIYEYGYTDDECHLVEINCLDTDGEFSFGESEDDFLCHCSWE